MESTYEKQIEVYKGHILEVKETQQEALKKIDTLREKITEKDKYFLISQEKYIVYTVYYYKSGLAFSMVTLFLKLYKQS